MADEDGAAPPDAAAPAAEGEGAAATDEQADDVAQTTVKIDEVVRRISHKQSINPRMTNAGDERVDVDRTALEAILDVSSRIQDIQKKSKISMSTLALAHESYKDKQVNKLT